MLTPLAIEWTSYTWAGYAIGAVLVVLLFGVFLVPALIKINVDGKRSLGRMHRLTRAGGEKLGPMTPAGAGDNHPGRRGDPAPGMPDGQPDPWSPVAQREAPPIKS